MSMIKVGGRIEQARKQSGLTRPQLSRLIDCQPYHIRDLETGIAVKRLPELLPKIAKATNRSISWFFGIESSRLEQYKTALQLKELITQLARELGE